MTSKHKTATRIFLAVQALFAIGAFLFIYFSGQSAGAPIVGQSIFEPDILFELAEGEELLIADNLDFINPIILQKDSELQLFPGDYYWKVRSWKGESEVKTFTVYDRVNPEKEPVSGDYGKGITSISIDTGKSVEVENE